MDEPRMVNGVAVTEAQILEWAAEAEAGYDIAKLPRAITVRLPAEELTMIDAVASQQHKTSAELVCEIVGTYLDSLRDAR